MTATPASLEQHQTGTTFTAVIGHADDAGLLQRCIEHHLTIGVDRIFVSLNGDDHESAAVTAAFPSDRVRGAPLRNHAPDALRFMTAAFEVAQRWADPDWVLFLDSDEFWLPASGQIRATRALDDTDLFIVDRYNSPPLRHADGAVTWADPTDRSAPLFVKSSVQARTFAVTPEENPPWIRCAMAPKVMVRAAIVERVGGGAHGVAVNIAAPRTRAPDDLLIMHLPFTERARFRHKVEAIRGLFENHSAHDRSRAPPHWKRWVEVAAQGALDREFDLQTVAAHDLEALRRDEILTSPSDVFAPGAATAVD